MLLRSAVDLVRYAKPLLLLLFWQFSVSFIYNTMFNPTVYFQFFNDFISILIAVIAAITFLCLAPLASFVADVKCGRFKTLLSSTYVILVSNTVLVGAISGFLVAKHDFGYLFTSLSFVGSMACLCGMVFFLANIVQFGTDQLRDAPTRHSVVFLYAVYWCERLNSLLVLCIHVGLPNQYYIIHPQLIDYRIDSILLATTICFSMVLPIIAIVLAHKKKHWLLTEHSSLNPYLLIWRVLKFAAKHRKPIRRSAFTYCENGYPSRLDFGKQRYGGPFTTEQVEDVKTLFNILKVLLCLAPVFYLENCTVPRHHTPNFLLPDFKKQRSFKDGIISEALAVVLIPLFTKSLLSNRFLPNMFKRMGFSIACLLLTFVLHILYDALGNGDSLRQDYFLLHCKSNETGNSTGLNTSFSFTFVSVSLLVNVIHFIYGVLLYVTVWEFICCQSPQHMKGLLFGILYAVRAFNQLLADFTILILRKFWHGDVTTCNRTLHLLNVSMGVLLVIVFAVVSRRYRYRKRDDICNIYQYAENYYSNYGSIQST